MELCEKHKYAYVIYDARECPLCKAEEEMDESKDKVGTLENALPDLES